jgi:glycosyltransferase involved in cell wall biosynthesis
LKRRLAVPFAMTFHALGLVRRRHQGADDGFDDRRFDIESRLMCHADAIVAECEQDEHDMIDLYGAPQDRIDCVPCGFDPEEFACEHDARARLGIPEDEFVVLQLGRMVARKGVDNVIRGVGALAREHGVQARLLIVGGNGPEPDPALTPEIGRLMEIARKEGLADRVQFTGSRPRRALRTYYSAADVFVTTPWYEPFGITPLEAMACARPVIGAAVGGLKSTIVDGKTGYLVPPNDPPALAERLARLREAPGLARRMGRAGRRRVVERYTWGRVVDGLERVYARALERSRGSLRRGSAWARATTEPFRPAVGVAAAENAGA